MEIKDIVGNTNFFNMTDYIKMCMQGDNGQSEQLIDLKNNQMVNHNLKATRLMHTEDQLHDSRSLSPLKRGESQEQFDQSSDLALESNIKSAIREMERRILGSIADQRGKIVGYRNSATVVGNQEELNRPKDLLSEHQRQIEMLNFKLEYIMSENNKLLSPN